jgi:hypothetical protein
MQTGSSTRSPRSSFYVKRPIQPDPAGAAIFLGKFVILSEAKNLRDSGQILRFAQNDRLARIPCRTGPGGLFHVSKSAENVIKVHEFSPF